jgi:hypothetical protein
MFIFDDAFTMSIVIESICDTQVEDDFVVGTFGNRLPTCMRKGALTSLTSSARLRGTSVTACLPLSLLDDDILQCVLQGAIQAPLSG